MIYESKYSILALSTVIERQHNQQSKTDGGGQSESQQPKKQRQALSLCGLVFGEGLAWLAAGAGRLEFRLTHPAAPRQGPAGLRVWPAWCRRKRLPRWPRPA